MREIKFRAWSTIYNENEMFYDVEMLLRHDGQWWMFNNRTRLYQSGDRCAIMQYTGLKDNKGLDIYDGDILQWDHTYSGRVYGQEPFKENPIKCKGIVTWMGVEFYISGNFKLPASLWRFERGENHNMQWEVLDENFEVIGNIYENPELLNQQP